MSLHRVLPAAIDGARLFTDVTGIPCVVLDRTGAVLHPEDAAEYPCRLCRRLTAPESDPARQPGTDRAVRATNPAPPDGTRHLKWVDEAVRFGGRSIFMCSNAFTHWTAPVMEDERLAAALVAGPVLTIDEDGFFENELIASAPPGTDEVDLSDLRRLFDRVPRLEPARVTTYSELLRRLAIVAGGGGDLLRSSEEALGQQSRINEYVQELKSRRRAGGNDPEQPSYPLEKEQLLLDQIRGGDVGSAQETLNELLGHVFFESGIRMDQVKVRARELIVLLSRAVLTEGAEPEEVFGLNYQFVEAIDHQSDINGVAYWMARIVRRFADLILYLPHLRHARPLRRALTYIREHSSGPLKVADVAASAGMSSSHFSRVFRAEIGESFVSYVNRIRCEEASALLRQTDLSVQEVAHRVGFSDHSYFSKVFRSITGAAPSSYRAG